MKKSLSMVSLFALCLTAGLSIARAETNPDEMIRAITASHELDIVMAVIGNRSNISRVSPIEFEAATCRGGLSGEGKLIGYCKLEMTRYLESSADAEEKESGVVMVRVTSDADGKNDSVEVSGSLL